MIHVLQKQSQGSQGLPNVDYGGPTDPEFQAIGIWSQTQFPIQESCREISPPTTSWYSIIAKLYALASPERRESAGHPVFL